MFKVSARPIHAHLYSLLQKFWTAFATGFWGRSFQIFCSLVWSSFVGLLSSFQHGTPHVIIMRIKIWQMWWPFIIRNEVIAFGV